MRVDYSSTAGESTIGNSGTHGSAIHTNFERQSADKFHGWNLLRLELLPALRQRQHRRCEINEARHTSKYPETYDMVIGSDGQPRAELFVESKLHFNAAGYKLLTERVRSCLPK